MRCLAFLQTTDNRIAEQLPALVLGRGLTLTTRAGPADLWYELRRHPFDLVVTDRRLLGEQAAAAVQQVRGLPDAPEVVVLIARDETAARAELLAAGALAVLSRETQPKNLGAALLTLANRAAEARRIRALPSAEDQVVDLNGIMTSSPRMRDFIDLVRRVATSESSLLLQGETGSGKEYLARAIHATSRRRAGPFVPIHCAALSEALLESELFGHVEGAFTGASRSRRGYFELADGGTLFLDEIGEVAPALQVKLLRVLQDRKVQPVGGEELLEVDVRLIAATNRNLVSEVEGGRFRPDLFYRLSVVSLHLPPLRERTEDILDIAERLVRRSSEALRRQVHGIDPSAAPLLVAYDWPGNVRELMNVMERAVLLANGTKITPDDLPFGGEAGLARRQTQDPADLASEPFGPARDRALAAFEAEYFRCLLTVTGGNLTAASRLAELNPRSLYEKMKRHGLRKEQFRQQR